MRTMIAPFSCLTVAALFSFAQPAHSAANATALSVLAFKSCDDAITSNSKHTILPIKKHYAVKLFVTNSPRAPNTTNVVVWIENKSSNKETPKITAVCVNKKLNLPTQDKGEIKFSSKPKDTIKMRFHLENLKISRWKKNVVGTDTLANDSILMKEFTAGTPPPPATSLTLSDWPSCLGDKTVHLEDDPSNANNKETEITFDFSSCANPSQVITLNYVYLLVLAQDSASGGAPTDYPIDPLIINKP